MEKENLVNATIDGQAVSVTKGTSILEAARSIGVAIPAFCYLKDVTCPASCRICVVEVEGMPKPITSCNTPLREGMVVRTATAKVIAARKSNLELLLSNHNKKCLSCQKSTNCTLQKLSLEYGCDEDAIGGDLSSDEVDSSQPCIVKDLSKCIQCSRCVAVCKKVQSVSAITKIRRGFKAKIGCVHDGKMIDSTCVGCGQCTLVCPTGALMENSHVGKVLDWLADPSLTVIAQIAPAVRVGLAEEFGGEIGEFCEGKIATALRMVGFAKSFDVNTGADFTVMEEGNELVERITKQKNLPMFSSCCPGWYRFVQEFYPDYVDNLSTCKSPTEMLGALVKTYFAEKNGLDPNRIKVVDIMPCTAKKGEKERADDVDAVLTTRELAALLKKKGIDLKKIPESRFDSPLGEYSGAALIFGVSGGVTEAVLRSANKLITGKEDKEFDFNVVRDSEGIKEATVTVGGVTLNIAIVNGLGNARKVMDKMVSGESKIHFMEVMACPGGCVNGGGQPYLDKNCYSVKDIMKTRGGSLYKKDKEMTTRASHTSTIVAEVYDNFIKGNRELAHKLFHVKGRHKQH